MITVYLAHAYGGDAKNRAEAMRWFALLSDLGFAVIADWLLLTQVWDESRTKDGLEINKQLIENSDVVLLAGVELSDGMLQERHHAHCCDISTVRFLCLPETEQGRTLLKQNLTWAKDDSWYD